MAATNMTAQSKDITGIVAGGDGKFRPYDLAGLNSIVATAKGTVK